MIVRFADIGGIVEHQCLNFLAKIIAVYYTLHYNMDRRGRDRMVIGFTLTLRFRIPLMARCNRCNIM